MLLKIFIYGPLEHQGPISLINYKNMYTLNNILYILLSIKLTKLKARAFRIKATLDLFFSNIFGTDDWASDPTLLFSRSGSTFVL